MFRLTVQPWNYIEQNNKLPQWPRFIMKLFREVNATLLNPYLKKNICKKSWEAFAVRFYIIAWAGKQYPFQEELLTGMDLKHSQVRRAKHARCDRAAG